MLMEETKAAARARLSGRVEGVRPPPISTRPPTAVSPDTHAKKTTFKRLKTQCHKKLKSDMDSWPEMALVTDMRGECRAGVTPHTVWYPTIPAKPKVVTIWVKAALGEMMPRARQVETPAERHSSVVVAVRLFIWKEMCRFCHLFRSLFKLYSNGITEE